MTSIYKFNTLYHCLGYRPYYFDANLLEHKYAKITTIQKVFPLSWNVLGNKDYIMKKISLVWFHVCPLGNQGFIMSPNRYARLNYDNIKNCIFSCAEIHLSIVLLLHENLQFSKTLLPINAPEKICFIILTPLVTQWIVLQGVHAAVDTQFNGRPHIKCFGNVI